MPMDAAPSPPDRIAPPRDGGFTAEDWAVLARCWFPVARADAVVDTPAKARLLDTDLVLWRAGGAVRAARDLCAHRGAALSRGWVEDETIVCPYHGFRYATDGRCVRVPAHPDMPIAARLRLAVLPAEERFGLVWVTLNGPPAPDLPEFPAWYDPAFQAIMAPSIDVAGSAGRQVEGFLDVAHFAWAHVASFGDRENPVVPGYQVSRTARGVRAEYVSSVSNYPKGLQHLAPPGFLWLRDFEVFPPFTARLVVHFPYAGRLWILNAACPIGARQTRVFCPLARNFDRDGPLEAVHAFNQTIFEEGRAIVESQRPEDLPLDPSEEAHIAADRMSIAYRRVLREMGLGRLYVS
jgi:phenylpropionate dioxygenase-like ring-hydroxylating dioxygenase large terminal subunit